MTVTVACISRKALSQNQRQKRGTAQATAPYLQVAALRGAVLEHYLEVAQQRGHSGVLGQELEQLRGVHAVKVPLCQGDDSAGARPLLQVLLMVVSMVVVVCCCCCCCSLLLLIAVLFSIRVELSSGVGEAAQLVLDLLGVQQ